jgi:O-antigen ligase
MSLSVKSSVLIAPGINLEVQRASSRSVLDSVILYGVVSLLLFGPLAAGAVRPWAIFVLEMGAALLFALWVVRQATAGVVQFTSNPLFSPMLVFAALIALQLATGASAYRYHTFSSALLYCAYGLLCFLVVQCLRRSSQIKALAWVFSVYGFVLAMFALVQSITSNGKLYWLRTPRFGGWIYGPYVNHNHYAGLMEMLVPIPLIFFLTSRARDSRKAMAALAAGVMASTIFLSGSRGGMAAFMVQMVVLAVVLLKQRKARRSSVGLSFFMMIVVGLLIWLGGTELTKRMASINVEARQEVSGGMRMVIDRDGLKMYARRPVLGWGLGVFPDVYPRYRSFYTHFFVNQAHNDYLQLLVEMGTLGLATMIWFIVLLYRSAIKKLGNWTEDTNGTVALATMLGGTGILVHSFVDFNLQVPANAALFYVLCVIAAFEPRFGQSIRKAVRRQTEAPQFSPQGN